MTKEKKEALMRYQALIRNKMSEPTPVKHKSHPETYKAFLARELRVVTEQLEADRLEMQAGGK
jgi:hypothetical protein